MCYSYANDFDNIINIGAYKLYNRILKPFFEKYEDDIDQKIEDVTSDIRRRSVSTLQRVVWSVLIGSDSTTLLAPVQSLLTTAESFLIKSSVVQIDRESDDDAARAPLINVFLSSLEGGGARIRAGRDAEKLGSFHTKIFRGGLYLQLEVDTEAKGVAALSGVLPLSHTAGGEICESCATFGSQSLSEPCGNSTYFIPLFCVNSVYEVGDDDTADDLVGMEVQNTIGMDSVTLYLTYDLSESCLQSPETPSSGSLLTSCLHIVSSGARGKLWRRLRVAVSHFSKILKQTAFRKWLIATSYSEHTISGETSQSPTDEEN